MGFKKAKPTWNMKAGRDGSPKARKPSAKKYSVAMGKKPKSKNVATYVVGNGKKIKTGPMKGAMNNYRMGKAVAYNTKPGSKKMYAGKKQSGKSATNSPQSTPMARRPLG